MQDLLIGERIHLLREQLKKQDKKKYSLQGVADRVGLVTKQSLSLIERGKIKNPSSVIINKLAADFGVTADFLLTGIVGHKEEFLDKKRLLVLVLESCRHTLNKCRLGGSPALFYLYEKAANLLDLFDVVVLCLEREVVGNYDHYTEPMQKLVAFLEFLTLLIPLLGEKKNLEKFLDKSFWDLGKVIRKIAAQIDQDGNLRNIYPEELLEIANTVISVQAAAVRQEIVDLPQTVDVVLKDFHLRLTYPGILEIPEDYLTEFKNRVIFEWELMLSRINSLEQNIKGNQFISEE